MKPKCTIATTLVVSALILAYAGTDKVTSHTTLPKECATLIDEYGNIKGNDTKARLDNAAIQAQNSPGVKLYMIVYGPRHGPAGAAQRRLSFQWYYLVDTRGLDPSKVDGIFGGYREEIVNQIWLVPRNCPAPLATPTVPEDQVTTMRRPEVGPARLALLEAFIREFRSIPELRGGPPLTLDYLDINFLKERNNWAWVEAYEGSVDESATLCGVAMWTLLHRVNGRWQSVAKKAERRSSRETHLSFVRSVITSNPTAPREIFNTSYFTEAN